MNKQDKETVDQAKELLMSWIPDFTIDPDDRCTSGGGHEYFLEYENDRVQVLQCKNCGYRSIGVL